MKHNNYETEDVTTAIGVPFFHRQVESDPDVLSQQRQRVADLVDEHPDGYGANWTEGCGSWNSSDVYDNVLENEPVFDPVKQYIGDWIMDYAGELQLQWGGCTPLVTNSWLNASPKGNVQECHKHSHCYISGVYYIHIPEGDGGEFVLDNPLEYDHNVGLTSQSLLSDARVNVQSGDMILFPSHMDHHTRVNKSEEMRYSLAFNVNVTELLPEYFRSESTVPWDGEQE